MILRNKGEKYDHEGVSFEIGAEVKCTDGLYYGLTGVIISIYTDEDKETENPEADIHVDFYRPVLSDAVEALSKRFAPTPFDAVYLDGIIMAPSQLQTVGAKDLPQLTVYVLTEDWVTEDGEYGVNNEVYTSMDAAKEALERHYRKETAESDFGSWVIDVGEDYFEAYEDGHYNDNHYCLQIQAIPMALDAFTRINVSRIHDEGCYKEDVESRLYGENVADGAEKLTDEQKNAIINDSTLYDRIDSALSKNDSYSDSYWCSVEHVISELIKENEYDSSAKPMTLDEYLLRLSNITDVCQARGAEFTHNFFSNLHLDCIWYDGAVATVKYRGHEIHFDVCGEVAVWVDIGEDEPINIHRKGNGKPFTDNHDAREYIKDDATLHQLERDGIIEYCANNWVSVSVYTEVGNENVVESEVCSSSNVLKAVEECISEYFDKIDALCDGNSGEQQ